MSKIEKVSMRYPVIKQELEQWIIAANELNYSIPCVLNGGGFSWIRDWQAGLEQGGLSLADDDDYFDVLEYLKPGEEFADFRDFIPAEDYGSMVFVRVVHDTGFNQENFDYQFGLFEIIEIDLQWPSNGLKIVDKELN